MGLIALEIPDDTAELAGWLEGHLVGLDLSALVAELEAVHGRAEGPATPPLSLETVLGNQRDAVLTHGLASLHQDRLRQLLRHPRLLLDLQELILSSACPYWHRHAKSINDQVPASEQRTVLNGHWAWLTANVIEQPTMVASIQTRPAAVHSPLVSTAAQRGSRPRWRSRMLAALAAAAAVVLAILTLSQWPGGDQKENVPPDGGVASSTGWGWNGPDALPQDFPRDAYLNHLADGAQAWFNKRPDDRAALAQRITEFRHGCTVLLQSPHKPLPEGDRTWLIEKCGAWSAKLGTYLAELESGQDVAKVSGEADQTINKLITALRDRARGEA